MILGVNHITISVPSLDRALAFYCDLLGFEKVTAMSWQADSATGRAAGAVMGEKPLAADAAHLRASNIVLEIFEFKSGGAQVQESQKSVIDHGYTHFCLATTDLDAEYARLKAGGMMFLGEPVEVAPGVRSVYGRDPFGNVIELEEAAGRVDPSQSALQRVRERLSNLALGIGLLVVFGVFFLWQTPSLWREPLTVQEIEQYAAALERNTVMDPAEKKAFIERIRQWAAEDDGQPVLMVNLMRFREALGELPPSIDFAGTPAEANEYYEALVAPLALKRGEYPLLGGDAQATSLTPSVASDASQWHRVVVMRAPSRRAFIEFVADPQYGPTVPYKLAATDVVLIPINAEILMPELRWLVGALLLLLYLAVRWGRSAGALRRARIAYRTGKLT